MMHLLYTSFLLLSRKKSFFLTFICDVIPSYTDMQRKIWGLLGLFLSGCQGALDLPPVEQAPHFEPLPAYTEQRKIAFTGGLFDLKRGDLYAAYPYWHWALPNVNVGFYVCNSTMKHRFARSQSYWNEDENILGAWPNEIGTQIEQALIDLGYQIKQHRQSYFDDLKNKVRAELLLSVRVTDMKLNLCYVHAPFTLQSMDRAGGEGVITAEWEIYDTIREKGLGSYTTQGYGHIDEPLTGGDKAVFMAAAKDAARNLGKTDWFKRIMSTQDPVDLIPKTVHKELKLSTRSRMFHQPVRQQFSVMRKAIISVQSELSHKGSGFFINQEGYALTTAGIVGDAKFVQITDVNGTKYRAKVLRTDERRDVALIKADIADNFALPISDVQRPDAAEPIYAIGTPYHNNYRATITQGIVSANRYFVHQGLSFIQASVPTVSGYSGGPLTDAYGNVIGLSRTIADDANETHLSLFIPIHEALKALNINLTQETFNHKKKYK